MDTSYKIGVVDDITIFRNGLSKILNSIPEFKVVFEVEDGLACIEKIEQGINVHLLIADFRMPRMNGLELCNWIKKNSYLIKVILISGYDDDEAVHLFTNFADGFVCKDDDLETIIESINVVINNGRYFPKRNYDNFLNDWFEDA
jgi:two-component system, NarL family, response regulator